MVIWPYCRPNRGISDAFSHAHFVTTTPKPCAAPGWFGFLSEGICPKLIRQFFQVQGGPLMHVIAAKAVALKDAQTPEFADYQNQVVENARTLSRVLQSQVLTLFAAWTTTSS